MRNWPCSYCLGMAKVPCSKKTWMNYPKALFRRKDELVHYMEMAYTAIKPFYEGADAQSDAAKALLRRMEFGKDGYIFGYNDQGIRVV